MGAGHVWAWNCFEQTQCVLPQHGVLNAYSLACSRQGAPCHNRVAVQVLAALSVRGGIGGSMHVPYRDSRLTQLLWDGLR